jgi:hypothetical protein
MARRKDQGKDNGTRKPSPSLDSDNNPTDPNSVSIANILETRTNPIAHAKALKGYLSPFRYVHGRDNATQPEDKTQG